MDIYGTAIEGPLVIEPTVFRDDRGFFIESFHEAKFQSAGLEHTFVQDGHSRSKRRTLRGLHYQNPYPQGKLVSVIRGEIFDVAVDLRRASPTFGRWAGFYLSEDNHRFLYIPPGFAHGFCVTSNVADVTYKCTDFYPAGSEHSIAWNDPQLAIDWPVRNPILSPKDQSAALLAESYCFGDATATMMTV
ncbi:dTDP-4-dehydrorhamnose 3,5-epimerase [Lacipirellula parvula]|uniref:dTDP-4-dehydrorhamnose 3,5-epimerase n=1 Tax=Lacipirellula parvula TaxID=2650471 RepID=A0A5K7XJ64_9BACT|nr:dTDP-4-dehydrorhamnose 3,5-epimerase [Lacipirellula parvula]BBO34426.1 dTDP-4-dehydrorhamnose 3,5-epimerase [Lacipirellula parvula]